MFLLAVGRNDGQQLAQDLLAPPAEQLLGAVVTQADAVLRIEGHDGQRRGGDDSFQHWMAVPLPF